MTVVNDRHNSATQDGLSGVVPWRAGDAAARVRSGTAHPQPVDRRTVLCPTGQRPHKEHLFERDVAMKNIAFGDAEGLLEIKRCIDAARNDRGRHVWCKPADQFGNPVAKRFAQVIPATGRRLVRQVLYETCLLYTSDAADEYTPV